MLPRVLSTAPVIQREFVHSREELLADARDRDVVDVDLLFANQREEQVEGTGEGACVDEKCGNRRVAVSAEGADGRSGGWRIVRQRAGRRH